MIVRREFPIWGTIFENGIIKKKWAEKYIKMCFPVGPKVQDAMVLYEDSSDAGTILGFDMINVCTFIADPEEMKHDKYIVLHKVKSNGIHEEYYWKDIEMQLDKAYKKEPQDVNSKNQPTKSEIVGFVSLTAQKHANGELSFVTDSNDDIERYHHSIMLAKKEFNSQLLKFKPEILHILLDESKEFTVGSDPRIARDYTSTKNFIDLTPAVEHTDGKKTTPGNQFCEVVRANIEGSTPQQLAAPVHSRDAMDGRLNPESRFSMAVTNIYGVITIEFPDVLMIVDETLPPDQPIQKLNEHYRKLTGENFIDLSPVDKTTGGDKKVPEIDSCEIVYANVGRYVTLKAWMRKDGYMNFEIGTPGSTIDVCQRPGAIDVLNALFRDEFDFELFPKSEADPMSTLRHRLTWKPITQYTECASIGRIRFEITESFAIGTYGTRYSTYEVCIVIDGTDIRTKIFSGDNKYACRNYVSRIVGEV